MKNKFRNHPSLILEKTGFFWGVAIFLFFTFLDPDEGLDEWEELLTDMQNTGNFFWAWIVIAAILAVFLLYTALNVIRWYKTWIYVDLTSITISVSTLNQSVNTIGIKNISNVNIERNLFETIIGTSKVKIDTDSYSTAETTDMKIVLKKDEAEMLRQHLLAGINENENIQNKSNGNLPKKESNQAPDTPEYAICCSNKDILVHCMFTAPISGILFTLAGISLILFCCLQQFLHGNFNMQDLAALCAEAGLILPIIFLGAIYRLIKDFFKYYRFQVRRTKNFIQITFGLWKRSNYEIPIDRINSIVINKSVISRLAHRCCVDLINVGIGDDDKESTRLFLSVPDKCLGEVLHKVLPEFDEYFQNNEEPSPTGQPKKIWWKHGIDTCLILIIAVIIFLAADSFHVWTGAFPQIYWGSAIGAICGYLAGCYGSYHANRLQLYKKYLVVSTGIFAMKTQFVQYGKIQHMELSQSPILRVLHLQRSTVYILASVSQSMVHIPAFEKERMELMGKLFLEDGKKLQLTV